ncbi:methyltransferase domain-containing protein [Streptomyces litchfieldiae]|uniref:Protein-L-isoaspartate O-methyltransferase n=1 Tax=Streptomyces litchfieldiae TaxID=3075543 RepID=A0ABU2MKF5_9ACTN|nr:methyltransferase domain-containing protein [Streptomyces sp. DSM 44938]MDT0341594.1 protein-L-isoaspartate(D-aspartate) O-methyltransferase [Streptomyces sp. DSM 44938]
MTIATRPPADGSLRSAAWRAAFAAVPREAFVSPVGRGEEPEPSPVLTAMCEALDVPDGAGVLEVGTGTGYGAALLSQRYGADRVVSLDADSCTVAAARTRLARAGYTPRLMTGETSAGCPEFAPFGGLLASCGTVTRVPVAWPEQVLPGGTLVAALGFGLVALTIAPDGSAAGRFLPVLTPEGPRAETSVRSYIPALLVPLGTQADVELAADMAAEVPRFLGGLLQPDVYELALIDADGRRVFGLVHPDTGSWARVAPRDDGTARIQYDGPRDLWAERAPALAAWAEAGRPGPEAYGLTVTAEGAHRLWLGAPDGPGWDLMY